MASSSNDGIKERKTSLTDDRRQRGVARGEAAIFVENPEEEGEEEEEEDPNPSHPGRKRERRERSPPHVASPKGRLASERLD